ncbi:hypothetical protein GCK72_021828 [Caenorhabditis remanei]|uniref:G-protein coupled receptors family 1 profile domain-containing protein n=1 Tax=Caenorhabditis remanei TaxID=31234 RepID=A0A6A5GLV1_CAERE|nr:hypothetical protein GCK72_021828 [Caenorhabditis remanei]KAF1755259.1 hypothetical protein GCK72_021828 [Caenorhabditis remanei]
MSVFRCGYPPKYNQTKYIVLVGRKVIFSDSTSQKLYGVVNGAASVIPAVLYPVIAIVLLVQLWKNEKNRNELFSRRKKEKDHTTQLVILMTITFFISQLPFGLSIWLSLVFPYHSVISSLLDHGKEITSILFTINATCHCIIFATLSEQYREVAKEVYCCRSQKENKIN